MAAAARRAGSWRTAPRLLLYAATAYGWWWMRGRLRQREPSAEAHKRLLRTEIAAVIAVVALEASQLLRHG
ncbi:MAG: hypothetical protein B7Z52_03505 [Burkholderiales bacterium 12-64-5]|nr:MAG: hypothetical protein B7Z52_03505 [Burkholderiales bacterium 12-64-5]